MIEGDAVSTHVSLKELFPFWKELEETPFLPCSEARTMRGAVGFDWNHSRRDPRGSRARQEANRALRAQATVPSVPQ